MDDRIAMLIGLRVASKSLLTLGKAEHAEKLRKEAEALEQRLSLEMPGAIDQLGDEYVA